MVSLFNTIITKLNYDYYDYEIIKNKKKYFYE